MPLRLGRAAIAGKHPRRDGRGHALAAAMAVLASPAAAGEGGAITLDPITVEGAPGQQEALRSPLGFVATQSAVASKTDTAILEVPQSVSVVTRDQLTVRNVQSDPQALLYTPGIWAQPFGGDQNQNNPFFVIRGFTSSFGGSYVDGLVSPVNYRYEPFGIERFDVFRGPTSTLYGQSDPGGLVNRVSRRPPGEFEAELQAQTGTYDRAQVAADFGGPIDGERRFLYRLTALQRDADAPIDYRFGQEAPDERQYVAPAATVNFGEDTSLTLLGNYLQDKVGQEAMFRKENGDLTHIGLNQDDYGNVDYEHEMLGYAFRHRIVDGLELRQNFRYAHMDLDRLSLFQGLTDPTTTTVERFVDGFEEDRRDVTVDTQLQADVRTGPVGHTLLGGLDYQHLRDRYTFSSGLASPLNYRDPDYDLPVGEAVPYLSTRSLNETYGAYLQDQLKLGGFILTLGARHDWARQTTDDLLVENGDTQEQTDHEWTYRAGLSYVTPFGLAPYVSYATSFLPTSGTDIEGNQLEPTEGRQHEIGLKYKPTFFNGFFAVAAYDLVKENVLTADPDNGPFAQTQVGEVRSRGIEAEAHASLMAGLDLTIAYAYNDPEVTKDNPDATGVSAEGNDPTLAPRHLASAWLDYTFQGTFLRGLLLGGGARYVGSTYADPQNDRENDDYLLFDAAARYDLGNIHEPLRGASLALNANNLLDEDYTTCFSVFDCNWGVGRTVIATLSYRW